MNVKHKGQQKGSEVSAQKQTPRPGTEQVRSGANIQKDEERLQTPKQDEHLRQKEGQLKGKK